MNKSCPSERFRAGMRGAILAVALVPVSACCRLPPGRHGYTPAEYAARLAQVRAKAPPGFTTVLVPPFVVAGDGPPEEVRAGAQEVVAWATARLRADFFALDLGELIEVWLFRGEE